MVMRRTQLKIGIVSAALSGDAREAALRARQLGFAGLLFDAYSPQLVLPELSGSGRREFLHVLSEQNQQLAGLRADLEGKGLSPSTDIDRMIARVDRAMEAAAGLGAPVICVDLGPLPEPAREAVQVRPRVDPQQAGVIIIPTAAEVEAASKPPRPIGRCGRPSATGPASTWTRWRCCATTGASTKSSAAWGRWCDRCGPGTPASATITGPS